MRWGIFSVTLAGHGMFIDWKLIFFVLGNKRAIEECSKFPCTETGLPRNCWLSWKSSRADHPFTTAHESLQEQKGAEESSLAERITTIVFFTKHVFFFTLYICGPKDSKGELRASRMFCWHSEDFKSEDQTAPPSCHWGCGIYYGPRERVSGEA